MKNSDISLLARACEDSSLEAAYNALTTHCRRAARIEHPEGTMDNAGRFYPKGLDATVHMGVRSPSRAWPYSYMLRCRTLEHCELIYDADHDLVLALRRVMKAQGIDPCHAPSIESLCIELKKNAAPRSTGHRKSGKPSRPSDAQKQIVNQAAEG